VGIGRVSTETEGDIGHGRVTRAIRRTNFCPSALSTELISGSITDHCLFRRTDQPDFGKWFGSLQAAFSFRMRSSQRFSSLVPELKADAAYHGCAVSRETIEGAGT